MIRAEYKKQVITMEVSGSVSDIVIEVDNLLHHLMETEPEIVNGCLVYEIENLSKCFEKCDVNKVTDIDLLLRSQIKIEKGVDN